jgi:hypothetical protein
LGLHHATLAYNVYMASVLGFHLQLERLPEHWSRTEAAVFRRLVPGPGNWIVPRDLHHLSLLFGMPHNFGDLETVSMAAKFRVAHREATASGGLRVLRRARELDDALQAAPCWLRAIRWGPWFRDSFYHKLRQAMEHCAAKGVTIDSIEAALQGAAPQPLTRTQAKRLHSGVQRMTRARLDGFTGPMAEGRLRRKLERWPVPLFPRLRASRAIAVVQRLRRLAPPRVLAALSRTWFNGWCTARRFQREGNCLFGCRHGEDAVQHYLTCGALHRFGQRHLRLPLPASPAACAQAALLLDPASSMEDGELCCRALLLAAAYRLHCLHRRAQRIGSGDEEEIRRALSQAVKEAARGHTRAMQLLDSRWLPPRRRPLRA